VRAQRVSAFALTSAGLEVHAGRVQIARHRHEHAYAALILQGGYEESGSQGRYRVRAGEVLLHRCFDAHLDRFTAAGARILNLLLPADPPLAYGCVADPDTIARLAERDPLAASGALMQQLRALPAAGADWPDLLAQELRREPQLRLSEWAQRHGLAAATLSRGFRKVFAIGPAQFRAEARVQRALALVRHSAVPLARIAAEAGFADQAHMTRALGALTGRCPGHWRRSNGFKTASARD